MPDLLGLATTNLKLAAAGVIAVLVAGTGAAATTVTLSGAESEAAPAITSTTVAGDTAVPTADLGTVSTSDSPTVGITPTPSDSSTVGIRPTGTHGYCVSTAVHAVTAPAPGGNLGAAKSAAAHSCKKAKKAKKAEKVKKAKAAKPERAAKPAKAARTEPAKSKGRRPATG